MTAQKFDLEIDIIRHDDAWPDDSEALIKTAISTAIAHLGLEMAGPAELSVLLTDDEEQRRLNGQWRGKDSTTNVLSFPQIEPFTTVTGLLGDISLARETLEKEAMEQDKNLAEHMTHLVVHGFLHILGYDHLSDKEAEIMERLETGILAGLGIADPYEGS